MNQLFFTISLLFFSITTAYAHLHGYEEQDKPFNIKSIKPNAVFQAVEHQEEYDGCSGYIRAGYIQTDHSSASAVAGELGCGYQLNQYIKAHLGLFASFDPGFNSHNDNNIQADFLNQKKDSYAILGEAVLTLSYQQFEAHLGRQNIDSPHMDADDLRMIANLFEAYLVDYHYSDELYFGAGFVREASGWENGANASQFVSIGEAFGGNSAGAWLSWLNYQQHDLVSDIWFYYIPDNLSILYLEFSLSHQFTEDVATNFAVQYDWGKALGQGIIGSVNANTIGFMSAVSWSDVTVTAAYNRNFGDMGALTSIGGGPFFTSLEDQTLDAVSGNSSESAIINLEYNWQLFTFGMAAGKFNASNKGNYNKEEADFYINYSWKEIITTELMYAVVDDRNSEPDMHQVRAILTVRY